MADVLVYTTAARAEAARRLLASACRATGGGARLEVFATSGSLFGRLAQRQGTRADLVLGFGPYMMHAAGLQGLLEPYQPRRVAAEVPHHPGWLWTGLDSSSWSVTPGVQGLDQLLSVPRLGLPDPVRSEPGVMAVLAVLDHARRVDGDPERGWAWWQRRVTIGVALTEEATPVVAGASHVLGLDAQSSLAELAALPHAIALLGGARNGDAARMLIDELTGAATSVAPLLDVQWTFEQYRAVRERWLASGWSPLS